MKGGGGAKKTYTNKVTNQKKTESLGSSDNCANVQIQVLLSDPQSNALQIIDEGDLLLVRFSASSNRVEVLNSQGEVCGFVIHPRLDTLINCIRNGVVFEAVVEFVSRVSCTVLIQPYRR
ncbi:MAG: hypothetical protein BGO21_26215 [Dyadobacter sp. 50-39]|nr:MAG: hypothetical protein BGO21_26215 [Dyadobacter sp. 50-39]